ncbi:hypothetical protein GCM10025876_29610 [Demequina litorisediminis]|uniref:Uncharacterized protein n=1 Tax=Demequina litorisediminis TaxID=1849022 RepID=A0ABQ6IJ47_9MICO|nr:hypothetical protein GCM10025876_29610 [Demequina litorisediminis]
MKPAAARLLLLGTAGATRRLLGIVAGVAVGVAMLLVLLGAYLHMPERDARSAWQVGVGERIALDEEGNTLPPAPSDDVLLHGSRQDYFDGQVISVTSVAVTDSTSVAFPAGLDVLAPGEFYASPAVMDLVATTPADEFKNRYGTLKGVIPEEALRGPDELAVLAGADWDTLASDSSTRVQEEFDTVGQRYNATTYRTILAIGSVALLVPIVLLIGVVAQARRRPAPGATGHREAHRRGQACRGGAVRPRNGRGNARRWPSRHRPRDPVAQRGRDPRDQRHAVIRRGPRSVDAVDAGGRGRRDRPRCRHGVVAGVSR